jgi:hypothetical protein
MAIVSYILGRRYYPVAYDVKRVLGYITLGVGLYLAREQLPAGVGWQQPWLLSIELMSLYILVTVLFEGRQLAVIVKR